MQVDPMKPKLKPPGYQGLKLEFAGLLSNFAFKFNLRRYTEHVELFLSCATLRTITEAWRHVYNAEPRHPQSWLSLYFVCFHHKPIAFDCYSCNKDGLYTE